MSTREKAASELDWYLFRNVHNAWVTDEDKWEITFCGEDYLVHDKEDDTWHQFKVVFAESEFDFSEEIKDQEWCHDDDDNITTGTYAPPEKA